MSEKTAYQKLSHKHRAFVDAYVGHFNAARAYREVGYKDNRQHAQRLVTKGDIQAAIAEKCAEKAMSADEALERLRSIATGDLADFFDIDDEGHYSIDLAAAKEHGLTRLIKKFKITTNTTRDGDGVEYITQRIEFELHDAHKALTQILDMHGKFRQVHDVHLAGEVAIKGVNFATDEEA